MAMDAARLEWTARKEDEVNRVLENASSQLVEQFEEQKQEALEKAIDEARVRTLVERRPIKPFYIPYYFICCVQWGFAAII